MLKSVPGSERLVAVAAVAATAGLVVLPLIKLTQVAAGSGGVSISRVLRSPGVGDAALHSVLLACVVPLVAVPLGTATALFISRGDVACRGLLRLVEVVPLIVPQFVLGYSWTEAYGRAGFTDAAFGLHWSGLEGPVGIVVVLVVDAAPLCYLLTAVGLATRAQPDLEWAARLCGASGWTALRTVTLPLLRPVLAAEIVLIFIATLESFAVPEVLGAPAGFSTLTTRIYADLALASDPSAFTDAVTLSLGLVVLAAIVLLPADLLLGPRLCTVRTAQPAGAALRPARRRTVPAVVALFAYTVFAVGIPTLALVSAALTRAIGLSPTPSNWTLGNFRSALDAPTLHALGTSLQLAAMTATALTALGGLLAALQGRRGGRMLGSLALLTFALPGSTLAVGLLIAYGRSLGSGLVLILIAYLAKFWALAHRTVTGAADRVPHAEWHAARTSGASPVVAARTIWLPSLAPALLGAWLLVFLSALHEVTMSSLLYTVGNQTLAVTVLNSQQLGDVPTTAALSVSLTALIILAAVPGWLTWRVLARRRLGPSPGSLSPDAPAPEVADAH